MQDAAADVCAMLEEAQDELQRAREALRTKEAELLSLKQQHAFMEQSLLSIEDGFNPSPSESILETPLMQVRLL